MPTGTVKFFNESKGFGFIQPEDGGADSFVHISDVERSGMSTLKENQRVSYDVEQDQRGKMKATNLRAAEGGDAALAGRAQVNSLRPSNEPLAARLLKGARR